MNGPRPDLAPRTWRRQAKSQDLPTLPLGRSLVERGWITPWQLFFALQRQNIWNATLPEILFSRGWLTPDRYWQLHAERTGMRLVDLDRLPPDPDLAMLLPPDFCLKNNVIPWRGLDGEVVLATGRPDHLTTLRERLPLHLSNAPLVIAPDGQINAAIERLMRLRLTMLAEYRPHPRYSSRGWDHRTMLQKIVFYTALITLAFAFLTAPDIILGIAVIWAIITLAAATSLRFASLAICALRPARAPPMSPKAPLPRISVIVPLFREKRIANALIRRLTRLTYPRALLDVVLVLEEHDHVTRQTIAHTKLPKWMRVVAVPAGSGVTTKPRALNYALDFCKGEIIGIWDAEDAPSPDQLDQVAAHFASAPRNVACLQGILDYYNPYTNWLSRCFSIEYAAWFRIYLPGLTHMGFAVPLGGTTLFLRRSALERIGGWDAHNVTEDADLGYRLARFGYQTRLIRTVTLEEANCQPVAWIRQRSRWLKGYMVTYLVHMRSPSRLWRDLGTRKFLGFHLVFLTTFSQFLLAPLLWLLWGATLGWQPDVPGMETVPAWLSVALILSTLSNVLSWGIAAKLSDRPGLIRWIPAMLAYFPLATIAAYKGLIELVVAPYYWDKTEHGKTFEATQVD